MLYPYIKEAGLLWMSPIIFLSFIGLSITIERCYYWLGAFSKSRERKKKLEQIYDLNPFSPQHVLDICRKTKDDVLFVIANFIISYKTITLDLAYRKTQILAEQKIGESRKFLDILSLIANIAGTLGLMGTVVGISQSFKTLAREDPKGLASSLATAMYTTIGGIILFLMSYLFFFFFDKFSNKLEDDLEENIERIKDLLDEKEKSQPLLFDKPKKDVVIAMKQNKAKAIDAKKDNQDKTLENVKEKQVYEKKA